jgi:hypothetical protein
MNSISGDKKMEAESLDIVTGNGSLIECEESDLAP